MIKLNSKQIDFINKEIDINNAILASRPSKGIVNHIARQEALRIIVELHNLRDK
jgi:hypothetical protein